MGQGQPRIIIWANLAGPTTPMLHTKSQGYQPFGSGEDFWRVFTIYGHGGHLGHVTKTIWTNFCSPIIRRLHIKYEINWPSSFRGEDFENVDGRQTDHRRRSHWYTISSPMSRGSSTCNFSVAHNFFHVGALPYFCYKNSLLVSKRKPKLLVSKADNLNTLYR